MELSKIHKYGTSNGFSLVELSIVLVILGLLTGGVLTGQSLIRAAELRSVATEFSSYQTALNVFKGKYFETPGEMTNATAFWGDNATVCSDGNPDGTPGTCNGDGNGTIVEQASAAGQESEAFLFWQHLSLAGLIEGNYTGLAGTATADAVPGTNVPASKLSGACWHVEDDAPFASRYATTYGNHYFEFGADDGNNDCGHDIMPAEEAWNIDKKMDDGKPGRGNILSGNWASECTRATAADQLDTDYLLSDASNGCHLLFINAF